MKAKFEDGMLSNYSHKMSRHPSGIRLRVNRCVYNCRIENCPA